MNNLLDYKSLDDDRLDSDIDDVIGSRILKIQKRGYWVAKLNELENGYYTVTIDYRPYYPEYEKDFEWIGLYSELKDAQHIYDIMTFNRKKRYLYKINI